MTDDLVKRLRWRATSDAECLCGNAVCDKAADLIEKLEAALLEIDIACDYFGSSYVCRRIARKALEGKDE
jgi:hypothetical protein